MRGQLVGSLQRQLKQQVLSKCAAIRVLAARLLPHTPPPPLCCFLLVPCAAAAAFAFLVLSDFATLSFVLLFWLTNYVNVEIN